MVYVNVSKSSCKRLLLRNLHKMRIMEDEIIFLVLANKEKFSGVPLLENIKGLGFKNIKFHALYLNLEFGA